MKFTGEASCLRELKWFFSCLMPKKDLTRWYEMLQKEFWPHAWLVSGLSSPQKDRFLDGVVGLLLCSAPTFSGSCQKCQSCIQFGKALHPDKFLVGGSGESLGIGNARAIASFLSTHAILGSRKVAVIKDAHMLTREASSALLKLLEEPKGSAVILLETSFPSLIIPTIRSRLASYSFFSLGADASARDGVQEGVREYVRFFNLPFSQRLAGHEKRELSDYGLVLLGWELALRDIILFASGQSNKLYFLGDKDVASLGELEINHLLSYWKHLNDARRLLGQQRASEEHIMLSAVMHCFPRV